LLAYAQRRFGDRLGMVRIASSRHAYPLVTYAHRFALGAMALVGEAAVGMHPVIAHGFNFGLRGQARLVELLGEAPRRGMGGGKERSLQRYATEHHRVTRPLYLMTNSLARLFTAETVSGCCGTPYSRRVRG
jgi:2-polyprenyl-6-methoxyphenol hydroxylase-like FAD-dependent oxidoreductase